MFVSPADPTARRVDAPLTSYAANAQVFVSDPHMARTFKDGAAHTITFAEHYAYDCQGMSFLYVITRNEFLGGVHRPTFADGSSIPSEDAWVDVHPVTTGSPPRSVGSDPEATFQVAPRPDRCWSWLAQTPHPAGMLAAMGDGSVRVLARGIAPEVYWGAVTPAAGEFPGDW
jgi:hypothetical protein